MSLPTHYPFAAFEPSELLRWAHMIEPPYDKLQRVAPWLKTDSEMRSYLDGVIEGRIAFWRHGLLSMENSFL